jgi:hypothetical protein
MAWLINFCSHVQTWEQIKKDIICVTISPSPMLAERAGYICSNPSCNRITIGPDNANPIKSTKTGVVAHMCAAALGGARYDPSQTSDDRKDISNGIWLCATCSVLIDKNDGNAYPVDALRKWKDDHEKLIKSCLAGEKKLAFLPTEDFDRHRTIANELLIFMEQRGVLFESFDLEYLSYIIDSIKEIRTFLTQLQANLDTVSPLAEIVKSINSACRNFMNKTSKKANKTLTIADYDEVFEYLSILRKSISLDIGKLAKLYNLTVSEPLRNTISQYNP